MGTKHYSYAKLRLATHTFFLAWRNYFFLFYFFFIYSVKTTPHRRFKLKVNSIKKKERMRVIKKKLEIDAQNTPIWLIIQSFWLRLLQLKKSMSIYHFESWSHSELKLKFIYKLIRILINQFLGHDKPQWKQKTSVFLDFISSSFYWVGKIKTLKFKTTLLEWLSYQ